MTSIQTQATENAEKKRSYTVVLGGVAITALLLTLLANLLYGAIRNAAERASLETSIPPGTEDSEKRTN